MSASTIPHVVVLNGSPLYAEVYSNVFAAEGYRVTAMTDCGIDPADLLALLPDLVVLDLTCGKDLTGMGFLRRLRAKPEGQAVPVIVSTPASRVDTERYGAELRVLGTAIFDGPGRLDEMLAAARAATAQARETRERVRAALADLRTVRRTDPPG